MSKQPTSMRLPALTVRQIAELIAATGMTQSEVITIAIDRMYREEKKNMNTFATLVDINGTYHEMQINGQIDNLTQQWIDRHNPTRVEYRAARVNSQDLEQITEFDDYMDYRDEVRANLHTIVAYRIGHDNQAAVAEGTAIGAVLTGYHYNWNIGRRNWLIARGYTNVPELTIEPAPAGDLDYDWG